MVDSKTSPNDSKKIAKLRFNSYLFSEKWISISAQEIKQLSSALIPSEERITILFIC